MKKTFRSSSLRPLLVSIVAILFGFLVGSILLIASGQNPIQCFIALFKGGLSSKERIFNTFSNAIPLVFTGLSVTFAYKTGLFNIGATGQMVAAGLLSVITALTVDLPPAAPASARCAGRIFGRRSLRRHSGLSQVALQCQ